MANEEDKGAPVLSEQEQLELRQLAELILETQVSDELFEDFLELADPVVELARTAEPESDQEWDGGWGSFPVFVAADAILRELLLGSPDGGEELDDSVDLELRVAAENYGKARPEAGSASVDAAESNPPATDEELEALQDVLSDKLLTAPTIGSLRGILGASVPDFLIEARSEGWLDPAAVEGAVNHYLSALSEVELEWLIDRSAALSTPVSFELNEVDAAEADRLTDAIEELIQEKLRLIEAEATPTSDSDSADSAEEQIESDAVEGDPSPSDSDADTSDEGDWGLAEIDPEDELDTIEELSLDSEEEIHGHQHHVHQLLSEELRGIDDYDGDPADEREIATLALIAEGIIYAELSDVFLDDLVAEADPLIRKARALGSDWWMTTEAAVEVANLLSEILTGSPWPTTAGTEEEGVSHKDKLQRLAASYPLDPEPEVEAELSRAESLKAASPAERYSILLEERGELRQSPLAADEIEAVGRQISDHFRGEKPTPALIEDVASLLGDQAIHDGRSYGWNRVTAPILAATVELLLGEETNGWIDLNQEQSDAIQIALRTYRDSELTEDEFIAHYDQSRWPAVGATVDLSIFTILDGELQVLLIERGNHPEKGKWALPGGFVDIHESLDQAALRELKEETSVDLSDGGYLEQVRTYGYPGRDRRGYIVSTLYAALIAEVPTVLAGDDAAGARFVPVSRALSGELALAFDHDVLLRDALERVRAKLEYSPIVFDFLPPGGFELGELRNVYEIVWGFEILPSDFGRRISQAQGALKLSIKLLHEGKVLWERGPADTFFPPLDRSQILRGSEDL